MATRIQVLKTLAEEMTAFAQRFERKDPNAGSELEHYTGEVLMDRVLGEWSGFEYLVSDVQGTLDLSNAQCAGYDEKFAKHIAKYAAKLRDKAAGKTVFSKPKKS